MGNRNFQFSVTVISVRFKAVKEAVMNRFKELKGNMFKQLKKNIIFMREDIGNIQERIK